MNATALKDEVATKVADRATEVISNAAGAVADPRTGLTRARGFVVRKQLPLLSIIGLLVLFLVLIRRSRG